MPKSMHSKLEVSKKHIGIFQRWKKKELTNQEIQVNLATEIRKIRGV